VSEVLEKEENSIANPREWYTRALSPWGDSHSMITGCGKKEMYVFAAYRVRRPPTSFETYCARGARKVRTERAVCFRTIYRRRVATPISSKATAPTGLGYVPFETVKTFIELLELPHGWNSYSAKQIRKENVNAAVDLLRRIMGPGTPPPTIVPTVAGGVQLEWHTKGINLEIAIESASEINFFAEDVRKNEVSEEIDESALAPWIDRISER